MNELDIGMLVSANIPQRETIRQSLICTHRDHIRGNSAAQQIFSFFHRTVLIFDVVIYQTGSYQSKAKACGTEFMYVRHTQTRVIYCCDTPAAVCWWVSFYQLLPAFTSFCQLLPAFTCVLFHFTLFFHNFSIRICSIRLWIMNLLQMSSASTCGLPFWGSMQKNLFYSWSLIDEWSWKLLQPPPLYPLYPSTLYSVLVLYSTSTARLDQIPQLGLPCPGPCGICVVSVHSRSNGIHRHMVTVKVSSRITVLLLGLLGRRLVSIVRVGCDSWEKNLLSSHMLLIPRGSDRIA